RAEALTRICIADTNSEVPPPNCMLTDKRTAGAVPVLVPHQGASRDDIERTTDNPDAVKRTVPPGAQWSYALRPQLPTFIERRSMRAHSLRLHLIQFAIGWNVKP